MLSTILNTISLGAILIALTFGRSRRTVSRYSMLTCIAADIMLLIYYFIQDGVAFSINVVMITAMILAVAAALTISEVIEKNNRGCAK